MNKKYYLLPLLFSLSAILFAQDIIITKKGDTIEAKVITVYEAVIKYAHFSDPDGPTSLILKSNIESLTYENGIVENLEVIKKNTAASNFTSHIDGNNNAKPERIYKNLIRFKPLATVMGLAFGIFEFDLQYARYITPKFAIPIEIDFLIGGDFGTAFAFMTGIETVPITHRQKSGLFFNALAGIIVYGEVSFIANPNIGYQLVTKNGFVFNVALGPLYSGYTNAVTARFSLDVGFAF